MKQIYIEKSIGIDFQKEMTTIALLGKTLVGIELLDYQVFYNDSNDSEDLGNKIAANLNDFRNRNGLTNIRGAFCFPRNDIILKYIDIPTPEKKNIKDILEYEIEKHVPLNKDEIYYDFQIIKKKGDNLYNILIAVSRKAQVDHRINLLKEASIIPSLVCLSTSSNFSLLSFIKYDKEIINAIIEIGCNNINISFILEGSVSYTRSVPLPENNVWNKFFLESEVPNSELETATGNFMEFLIKEINLSLAGCRDITSEQAVDCFYLSGGGLLAVPIKKHLEQRVTGTVHILDPLVKLQHENGNISEKDRNFLANAVGAGIQNHIKGDFSINFLPEALRKYAQDNSFKTLLILSGILMFMFFTASVSAFLKGQSTLDKIENDLKKIKKEVIIAENLEREYEKISHQKLFLQKIRTSNTSRLRILKELTRILPPDVWLQSVVIKQDNAEIAGTADSTSKLVPLLEKSELFTDVHFIDSINRIKDREQFKIKLPLKNVVMK